MSTPWHGFLVLRHGDWAVELINHARTAAYLQNPASMIEGVSPCDVLDFGGCEAYAWVPCAGEDGEGELLEFDTPATDPAPWYNSAIPQSAEAMGFYITEWTGLDASHVGASFQPTGAYGGGGMVGSPSSAGRVMKLNVLIMASTERGMMYLFQWLSNQLLGRCNGCFNDSLYLRLWCPDTEDPTDGLVELRDVGVTEGLSWVDSASMQGSCHLREASFTLTAGDPCMYYEEQPIAVVPGATVADLEDCFTSSENVYLERSRCRPICTEMDESCRTIIPVDIPPGIGMPGLVIRLENDSDDISFPFRVSVYSNQNEVPFDTLFPCGLPLVSRVNVNSMPGHSSFTYDTATREALFKNITTGGFVDGSFMLQGNEVSLGRFTQAGCGLHLVTIEPLSFCVEETDDGWVDANGIVYPDPHLPLVAVTTRERVFCS